MTWFTRHPFSAVLTVIAALSVFAAAANAQDKNAAPAAGGYKIGVVDFKQLLGEYNKRKSEYDKLQSEVDKLQSGIDALAKQIEDLKKEYESKQKAGTLTDTDRQGIEQRMDKLAIEYRTEMERRQREIDLMEQRVIEALVKDIQAVIDQVGQEQNFHLIFDARSPNPPRGGVVYFSSTVDITSEVLARLNKKS